MTGGCGRISRKETEGEEDRVCAGDVQNASGVDGDDLTSTSAHQEDPIETFSENLKELHVWETVQVKECSFLK